MVLGDRSNFIASAPRKTLRTNFLQDDKTCFLDFFQSIVRSGPMTFRKTRTRARTGEFRAGQ
jgi:hypothetical protein